MMQDTKGLVNNYVVVSYHILSSRIVTHVMLHIHIRKQNEQFAWEWAHVLMKHGKPSRRNAQSNPERIRTENEQFAWEGAHFFMKPSKPSRRNAHSQSHRKKQNSRCFAWEWMHFMIKWANRLYETLRKKRPAKRPPRGGWERGRILILNKG